MFKSALISMALSSFVFGSVVLGAEKDCIYEDAKTSGIGTVIYSLLAPNRFKEVNGGEWVLMSGQSLVGKDTKVKAVKFPGNLPATGKINYYLTDEKGRIKTTRYLDNNPNKLPDARGRFFRVMDVDSEFDFFKEEKKRVRKAGETQEDSLKSHSHKIGFQPATIKFGLGTTTILGNGIKTAKSQYVRREGKGETRPKNASIYAYVKVRLKCVKELSSIEDLRRRLDVFEKKKISN